MTEPASEPPVSEIPAHWGRAYTAPEITVYYDRSRCIHYAACVRGLPEVFDTAQKPWIQPARAQADAVAEMCATAPPERCTTSTPRTVARPNFPNRPRWRSAKMAPCSCAAT